MPLAEILALVDEGEKLLSGALAARATLTSPDDQAALDARLRASHVQLQTDLDTAIAAAEAAAEK